MRDALGGGGGFDREPESFRRSREPRGRCGARPAARGRPTGTRDSEALAPLGPQVGQATYIEPKVPIHALRCCPFGPFLPTERQGPGSCVSGLSGRPGGGAQQNLSLSRSRHSLCCRSGPGALRLRTFHSSFHAPSLGYPLIGSAKSDVTALLPLWLRPSPFPV